MKLENPIRNFAKIFLQKCEMRKFRKDVFTKKIPRVVAATNNCAKKIMEFSRNDPVLNCGNLHDSSPRKA